MQFHQSNTFEIETQQIKSSQYYSENLYPLCIVWTILPCITWLIPVIGHTGACDSRGIIYDFLGMHINKRHMAFCSPRKFVKIDIYQIGTNKAHHKDMDYNQRINLYESSLKQANNQFSREIHNLCCNNCHHHVARFLNILQYRGKSNWTQVSVWWMFIKEGSYVTWWAPLQVYGPFILIVMFIVGIWAITKFSQENQ